MVSTIWFLQLVGKLIHQVKNTTLFKTPGELIGVLMDTLRSLPFQEKEFAVSKKQEPMSSQIEFEVDLKLAYLK